jgi:hypothetical protein
MIVALSKLLTIIIRKQTKKDHFQREFSLNFLRKGISQENTPSRSRCCRNWSESFSVLPGTFVELQLVLLT